MIATMQHAEPAHERLSRLCFIDYDREMAHVAEHPSPEGGKDVIGVARMIRLHGTPDAEFALLVSDPHQRAGLGTEMLRRLVQIGQREGVRRILADILPDNTIMQHVCKNLGFRLDSREDEDMVKATLEL